jgi:hypothetical protein
VFGGAGGFNRWGVRTVEGKAMPNVKYICKMCVPFPVSLPRFLPSRRVPCRDRESADLGF